MEFITCPICEKGRLLPFSDPQTVYAFWLCSTPTCGYSISRNLTEVTYYKGTAAPQDKKKGDKEWTQFNF